MGSRTRARGESALVWGPLGEGYASMGPPTRARGEDLLAEAIEAKVSLLQWGRGHVPAERAPAQDLS